MSVLISAPGGTLSDDLTRTEFCLFTAQEDLETMQAYAQVCLKYGIPSAPRNLQTSNKKMLFQSLYSPRFMLLC